MLKFSRSFGYLLFSAVVLVGISAGKAQAETFSIGGKSLNTNRNFRPIDGQPRISIWDTVANDPDQDFQRLPGNKGGVLLRHKTTGNCINAYRKWNGAEFNVWPCNPNDPDQNWQINSLGGNVVQLKLAGTNLCIDTPTRNNGGVVHLWTCDPNNANQRWGSNAINNPPPPPPQGDISLPFRRGQTWYVCQGYNGPITHQGYPALDLTVGSRDFGANNSCWAHDGNVSRSAGQEILAPASGNIVWHSSDLVCLSIDNNRSLLIGHIDRRVSTGQQVTKDTVLGIMSRANRINGLVMQKSPRRLP